MLHYHCCMQTGSESSIELEGGSSLEIALDRATERYRLAVLEGRSKKRARANDGVSMALVTTRGMGMPTLPVRLKWRGVEVSEEFQVYAARVALGEELAPYRGPVLARPCSEFQWSSFQQQREQDPTEPLAGPPFAARSLKHAAWLFGIAGGMLAAIGLGSGAFSAPPSDGYVAVDSATVALTPVAPSAREPAEISPSLDDSSDSIAEATPPPAPPTRAPRPAPSARRRTVSPAAAATVRPPAPAAEARALGNTASERTLAGAASPAVATPAGLSARGSAPVPSDGERTAARGESLGAGESSLENTGPSTLFSDQPPF
jgi:hypothetical protein